MTCSPALFYWDDIAFNKFVSFAFHYSFCWESYAIAYPVANSKMHRDIDLENIIIASITLTVKNKCDDVNNYRYQMMIITR